MINQKKKTKAKIKEIKDEWNKGEAVIEWNAESFNILWHSFFRDQIISTRVENC